MDAMAHVRQPFFYWRIEPVTRGQTLDLIKQLGLPLAGRHVTDLGPGNGASLRVFQQAGADTYFVERNPALYTVCRARGFRGALADFIRKPHPVPDIAYIRGSIAPSTFPDKASLENWLDNLGGNYHIISPWIDHDDGWFTETLNNRYERVSILGYQTPIYPATWVTLPRRSRTQR